MTHRYDILPHTADVGIVARGDSLAEVIANTAYGMFSLMYDLSDIKPEIEVIIEAAAVSPPELLVDCLSELIAVGETDDLVFVDFEVEAQGLRVTVTATGGSAAAVDLVGPPVKAVTYHDLSCERTGDHWRSQVIFDV